MMMMHIQKNYKQERVKKKAKQNKSQKGGGQGMDREEKKTFLYIF